MLFNAQSGEKPAKVVLTSLPDGTVMVALHDNIQKIEREEEQPFTDEPIVSSSYLYDEVMFPLPYDHSGETVKSVTESFSDWWEYGAAYTGKESNPTVEERLSVLEEALTAMMNL